jgi:hypothetical protein
MVPLDLQYLVGASMIVAAVVLIAFLWRGQRSMIALSALLAAPHALSAVLLVPHYWQPRSVLLLGIAIEDILFMIGVGGMAWIFSASSVRQRLRITLDPRGITNRYLCVLAGCMAVGFFLSAVPGRWRMTAVLLTMAVVVVLAVAVRRELWPMAAAGFVLSGASYSLAMIVGSLAWPEFMDLFRTENLWGTKVVGVPVEEIVWAFLFGPSWALVTALIVDARVAPVGDGVST